jgi:hypothetical protein
MASSSRHGHFLGNMILLALLANVLPWFQYFREKENMTSIASIVDSKSDGTGNTNASNYFHELDHDVVDNDQNQNHGSASLPHGRDDATSIPSSSAPVSITTQTASNVSTSSSPMVVMSPPPVTSPPKQSKTTSPYDAVQQHVAETKRELLAMQKRLGQRYISWNNATDKQGLTYESFKQQLVAFFQHHQSLVLIGDSTTRRIFGFLWCLMDDKYTSQNGTKPEGCAKLHDFLFVNCNLGKQDICPPKANFSNPDFANFTLAFRPGYKLAEFDPYTIETVRQRPSVVFVGLACLHSLWSPGRREVRVSTKYEDWPEHFEEQYAQIEDALLLTPDPEHPGTTTNVSFNLFLPATTSTTLLFATPNFLCNDKRGPEMEMIDAYLHDIPLSDLAPKSQQRIRDTYNLQLKEVQKLPDNYTGMLPVLQSYRTDHTEEDFALFNDNGSWECGKIATETLLRHFWKNSSKRPLLDTYVLDMRSATTDACEFTRDGVHYSDAILLQKASLILKAMAAA